MVGNNETVREVCAEIRSMYQTHEKRDEYGWRQVCESKWELCDRILAAYDRELAAKDAEIARLKAALKPVLEVNLAGLAKFNGIDCREFLSSVIAEAQRIVGAWDDKNYFRKENNDAKL